VNVKNEMTSIGQENPIRSIKTLFLEPLKLFKERGNMDDTSRSNEIDSARVYKTSLLAEFGWDEGVILPDGRM
jgi:hypothetical protein